MPLTGQCEASAYPLHAVQEDDLWFVIVCARNPEPEPASWVAPLKARPALLIRPLYEAPETVAIHLNEAGSSWFWLEPELLGM